MVCKGSSLRYKWHQFWWSFHSLIIKDCLDEEEKEKITRKIKYHEFKMNVLQAP